MITKFERRLRMSKSFLTYCEEANDKLRRGEISYGEWSNLLTGDVLYSDENLRRCFVFFSEVLRQLEAQEIGTVSDEQRMRELAQIKEDIIKERKKLQSVNTEAQEYYREVARHDLFNEKIVEAIKSLPPINIKPIYHLDTKPETTGLLCLSDLHAGSTFTLTGMYGEIVNQYNFDIMTERMNNLVGMIEADDIACDNLIVAICGDLFENMLRTTSLTKLREPVVDTVIRTSEFLAQWLVEFSSRVSVPIRVVIIGGNHDTCSFLGAKPRFEEENLTKIVVRFLELRFDGVKGIAIDPYTDVAITNIQGVSVMFEHGEDSNLQDTIEYFSNLYNVDVDEIYAGHLHRPESKAIGVTELGDRMLYRVGSICGVDTYAKRLRKSARPSAYFALYEKDFGHTWSKNYYL